MEPERRFRASLRSYSSYPSIFAKMVEGSSLHSRHGCEAKPSAAGMESRFPIPWESSKGEMADSRVAIRDIAQLFKSYPGSDSKFFLGFLCSQWMQGPMNRLLIPC